MSIFDAVVLVDVPALELDAALLDPAHLPLVSYIGDGGELVVIGVPDSYGVGGYTANALDDVLPVSMKLPQCVAVALIIADRETQANVNISTVAGEGVIKLLTPADCVAVNDASGTDAPGGARGCAHAVRGAQGGDRPGHPHHDPGRSAERQARAHGRLQRAAAHQCQDAPG